MKHFNKLLLIAAFGITTLFSTNLYAQRGEDYTTVNSEELVRIFDQDEGVNLITGFCQDITVTINLQFIEIETTITICCSNDPYICIPIIDTRAMNGQNPLPNDLEITNSSSVNEGSYTISIVNGRYPVNSKGEISGLKYKLISK